MADEALNSDDWREIALFYRQKYVDLELQMLAAELSSRKRVDNVTESDSE